MKKNYFVLKVYSENFSCANVVFDSDNKDDAFSFAELMNRNSNDSYSYHVGCWVEK